jgi:hypothetical protein
MKKYAQIKEEISNKIEELIKENNISKKTAKLN